jgi:hypothetical protein
MKILQRNEEYAFCESDNYSGLCEVVISNLKSERRIDLHNDLSDTVKFLKSQGWTELADRNKE